MSHESFNLPEEPLLNNDTEEKEPAKPEPKKSNWFKRVFAVGSAVAATSLGNMEAKADDGRGADNYKGQQPNIEMVESVNEINPANLTESSKWSSDIMRSVQEDLKKVRTAEDADFLLQTHFNAFVSEYYFPTKGNLKEGPYGTKAREYTPDDFKLLIRNIQEIKRTIEALNVKFGIKAFDERVGQANDMLEKIKDKSSYAGQKKKEILENMKKFSKEN